MCWSQAVVSCAGPSRFWSIPIWTEKTSKAVILKIEIRNADYSVVQFDNVISLKDCVSEARKCQSSPF